LIGCTLVRRLGDRLIRGTIVETEAYTADDPACHGYQRQTPRNAAMFGAPGTIYVYLIYGMYHCFNIATLAAGVADAVLIRAIALESLPPGVTAQTARSFDRLAAGPGKLCRVLQIDRQLSGQTLQSEGELWLEHRSAAFTAKLNSTTPKIPKVLNASDLRTLNPNSERNSFDLDCDLNATHLRNADLRNTDLSNADLDIDAPIVQTTRIGITQGIDRPWRWYLRNSPAVSKRATHRNEPQKSPK